MLYHLLCIDEFEKNKLFDFDSGGCNRWRSMVGYWTTDLKVSIDVRIRLSTISITQDSGIILKKFSEWSMIFSIHHGGGLHHWIHEIYPLNMLNAS